MKYQTPRVERLLTESGALKTGHFLLSSGLHSGNYCQCAALFEQPAMAAEMADLMAGALAVAPVKPAVVLAPALGGILWGYELARALGVRSLFAERPTGEGFVLRRGFLLEPGERVLLAEDVVTTGKSVLELVPLVEAAGAVPVGIAAVADRSRGKFRAEHALPLFALAALDFEVFQPGDCPLCRTGSSAEKPGSRTM